MSDKRSGTCRKWLAAGKRWLRRWLGRTFGVREIGTDGNGITKRTLEWAHATLYTRPRSIPRPSLFHSLSRILRSSSSVVYRGSKLNNIRNTRRHSIVSLSIERERKWREKLQRSRMFPSSFDIPLKRRNNGTSWPPSVPPSTVLKDGRQTEMAAARGKGRSNLTGLSQ